jgi:hypothetical protein
MAGADLPWLVIDVDASIVECHSEKEAAAPTFKSSFGYHPILAFLDNSGEFLAGCCGRATPARTPPPTTSASWTPRSPRSRTRTGTGPRYSFASTARAAPSVPRARAWPSRAGHSDRVHGRLGGRRPGEAIAALPARAWTPAVDTEGRHRDGAHVAELTGLLPAGTLTDYPPGTRILVRRERPHPGDVSP